MHACSPKGVFWTAATAMKGSAGSRSISLAALLLAPALLLPPQPAPRADRPGLSAEDVLRLTREGYPKEQIIRRIRLAESRYVLSADEAVALKEAGVSEPVIAEMLSRPEVRPVGLARSEAVAGAPPPQMGERARSRVSVSYSGKELKVERRLPPVFVASAGDKAAAVGIDGLEILVLSGAARDSSPLERAEKIAARLNDLAHSGLGRFSAADEAPNVLFQSTDGRAMDIVEVTAADAAAFQRRQGSGVSARAVASYWSALLNDYWSVAVAGKPPRQLVFSRDGQVLAELSRALKASPGLGGPHAIEIAAASMGPDARDRLRRLASHVPEEFSVRRTP
jgi:hypothetical protein